MLRIFLIPLLFVISLMGLSAGELFDSLYLDYYRYTDLQGISKPNTLGFHTYSDNTRDYGGKSHPWEKRFEQDNAFELGESIDLSIAPVTGQETWNSFNLKRGTNDGLQWQGKGYNAYLSGGLGLEVPYFSASIIPEFTFSENSEYAIFKTGDFTYLYHGIDYPTRMGDESFYQISPGQSEVRFDYKQFTAAFSHENMVWGPSIHNPLIMSAAAEGFYHTDLGLKKTETKWGSFEARFVYGQLEESDHFNDIDDDNETFFNGYMLAWSPPFNPFFTIGLNRSLICMWDDIDTNALTKLYSFAYVDGSLGSLEDKTDQRVSLWFDWSIIETGTNLHVEIFKEDHTKFFRSLLYYPDHTIGFTAGGEQVWPLSQKRGLSLNAEYSWMQISNTYKIKRGEGSTYYVHHYAYHGYTHKGQLLGAPTGPGSDAQFLDINYFDQWGMLKIYASRVNYDKDYVFQYLGDNQYLNAELRAGIGSLFFLPYGLEGSLDMSYLLVSGQGFEYDAYDHGLTISAGLTYRY